MSFDQQAWKILGACFVVGVAAGAVWDMVYGFLPNVASVALIAIVCGLAAVVIAAIPVGVLGARRRGHSGGE